MQAKPVAFGTVTKGKHMWGFDMYYIMTIHCFIENGPPSSDSESDGGDNPDHYIPKITEVLSAINACR